jgi:hypothetical protein
MQATTIKGKYITIFELNEYFSDVTRMVLEYYDIEKYSDSVVILGLYIFKTMGEIRAMYPDKRIVIFQLESLVSGNWHGDNCHYLVHRVRLADEVWEYDLQNSQILSSFGVNNTVIPFRYTESLDVCLDKSACDIDVLFYGFLNQRRINILHPVQSALYGKSSIVTAFGISGYDLDTFISRSKIILNMHAFDGQVQEQVRIIRPVCNGKMVLSEDSKNNYFGESIVEFDSVPSLIDKIKYYLEGNRYRHFGYEAKRKFRENSRHYSRES